MMKKTISLFTALCLLLALLPALTLPAAASGDVVEVSTYQQLLDACAAGGTRTVRLKNELIHSYTGTDVSAAGSIEVRGDLTLDLSLRRIAFDAEGPDGNRKTNRFSMFIIPEGSSLKVCDTNVESNCSMSSEDHCGMLECNTDESIMFRGGGSVDIEGIEIKMLNYQIADGGVNLKLGKCLIEDNYMYCISLAEYAKSDCAFYFWDTLTYGYGAWAHITRQKFASLNGNEYYTDLSWALFLSETPKAPVLDEYDYPSCAVNEPYPAYLPSADSNCGAFIWSASGLPDGWTMDPATGQISGTAPSYPGKYLVTVTLTSVRDSSLHSSVSFYLKIGKVGKVDANTAGGSAFQSLKGQLEDGDVTTVKLDCDVKADDLPCTNINNAAGALITVNGDKTLDLNGHSIEIVSGLPTDYESYSGNHVAVCIPEDASLRVTDSSEKADGSLSYVDRSAYEENWEQARSDSIYHEPGVLFWADGRLIVEKGSFSCGNSWRHWSGYNAKYLYRQNNGIAVWSSETGSAVIYGGSFGGRVAMVNRKLNKLLPGCEFKDLQRAGVISGYNLKICGGSFDGRGGASSVWPLGTNCSICGGTFTEADILLSYNDTKFGAGEAAMAAFSLGLTVALGDYEDYSRPKGQTLPAAAIKAIRPGTYIRYDGDWATAGDGTLSRQDTGEAIEGPYLDTAVLTPGLPSLSVLPETAVIHEGEYLMLSAAGRSSTDRPLSYQWIIRAAQLGTNDGRTVSTANTCGVFLSDLDGWTGGTVADGNTFTYTCIATDPYTGMKMSCDCPVTVSRAPLTKPSVTVDSTGFTLRTETSKTVTATFTTGSYDLADLQYRWTKDGVVLDGHDWQAVPESLTSALTITKDANEGVNYYECDIRETSYYHGGNTYDADFAQVRVRTASEFAISIDPTDLYFTLGAEKDAEITCSGNYGDFTLAADALPTGFTLDGVGTNGAGAVLHYDGTGIAQNTTASFTATVLNSQNTSTGEPVTDTKAINLHILAQPDIGDYILPDATVGETYSHTLTLSDSVNVSDSLTFRLGSGSLPAGLSLSSSGVISGTPRTVCTSTFTVIVKDNVSGAVGRKELKLTALARPTVQRRAMATTDWVDCTGTDTTKLVAFTGQEAWIEFQGVNDGDTVTIAPHGGGAMPAGCSVTYAGGIGKFTCGRTATAAADDTIYDVTVTTTTQSGGVAHTATATAFFTLTVAAEPKIITTDKDIEQQLTDIYGVPYVVTNGQATNVSLTFNCTGSDAETYKWTLSKYFTDDIYPTGAAVSGTGKTATVTFTVPAGTTDTTYSIGLLATYAASTSTDGASYFSIPCISGASGPTAVTLRYGALTVRRGVDVFGSIGFTSDAVPGAALTAEGLPAGLELVHTVDNYYYIFGTTQAAAGTYPVTITAVNTMDKTKTCSNSFSFTVAEPQTAPEPVISLPEGSYAGDQTVSIEGMIDGTNYAFFKVIDDATGRALAFGRDGAVNPSGTVDESVLNGYNAMSGYSSLTLDRSATLTAYTYGGLSQLLDSGVVTRHYTINNSGKTTLHITTSAIPDAEIGQEYSTDAVVALEPGVSWTAAGLPFGLNINSATGVISGLTYSEAGVYAVMLTAKKAGCYEASVTLPMKLKEHLTETAAVPVVTIDGEDVSSNAVTRLQSTGVYKLHASVTLDGAATLNLPVTWYKCDQNGGNRTAVGSGTSYVYSTAASGVKYYCAEAVNKRAGYNTSAGTSQIVAVTVSGVPADPIFQGEGGEVSCSVGATKRTLSELATAPDGGNISYTWHWAGTPDGFGTLPYSENVPASAATPEEGGSACAIDTTAAGVRYYRCSAVSTLGANSSRYVWSRVYKVTVSKDVFVDSVAVAIPPRLLCEPGETFNPAGMALDLHLSNDATQRMTLDDANKAALDIPSFTVGDAGELLLCLYKGGDKLPAPSESEGIPFAIPVVRHLASAVSAAITPPVIGSAPEFPTFSGDGFTAAVQSWKDGSGNLVSGLTDKFAAGNYTAKIAVKANSFCAFKTEGSSGPENSQPAFTVNGAPATFQSYSESTGEYVYTVSLAAVQSGVLLSAKDTGGTVICTLTRLGAPQAYTGNLCVVQYDAAGRMKQCRLKAVSLAAGVPALTVSDIPAFSYVSGDTYKVFFMSPTCAPLSSAAVPVKN